MSTVDRYRLLLCATFLHVAFAMQRLPDFSVSIRLDIKAYWMNEDASIRSDFIKYPSFGLEICLFSRRLQLESRTPFNGGCDAGHHIVLSNQDNGLVRFEEDRKQHFAGTEPIYVHLNTFQGWIGMSVHSAKYDRFRRKRPVDVLTGDLELKVGGVVTRTLVGRVSQLRMEASADCMPDFCGYRCNPCSEVVSETDDEDAEGLSVPQRSFRSRNEDDDDEDGIEDDLTSSSKEVADNDEPIYDKKEYERLMAIYKYDTHDKPTSVKVDSTYTRGPETDAPSSVSAAYDKEPVMSADRVPEFRHSKSILHVRPSLMGNYADLARNATGNASKVKLMTGCLSECSILSVTRTDHLKELVRTPEELKPEITVVSTGLISLSEIRNARSDHLNLGFAPVSTSPRTYDERPTPTSTIQERTKLPSNLKNSSLLKFQLQTTLLSSQQSTEMSTTRKQTSLSAHQHQTPLWTRPNDFLLRSSPTEDIFSAVTLPHQKKWEAPSDWLEVSMSDQLPLTVLAASQSRVVNSGLLYESDPFPRPSPSYSSMLDFSTGPYDKPSAYYHVNQFASMTGFKLHWEQSDADSAATPALTFLSTPLVSRSTLGPDTGRLLSLEATAVVQLTENLSPSSQSLTTPLPSNFSRLNSSIEAVGSELRDTASSSLLTSKTKVPQTLSFKAREEAPQIQTGGSYSSLEATDVRQKSGIYAIVVFIGVALLVVLFIGLTSFGVYRMNR